MVGDHHGPTVEGFHQRGCQPLPARRVQPNGILGCEPLTTVCCAVTKQTISSSEYKHDTRESVLADMPSSAGKYRAATTLARANRHGLQHAGSVLHDTLHPEKIARDATRNWKVVK